MSKKIIIGIVLIAAVVGGAWVFMRNNYLPSEESYNSTDPSLLYGSAPDAAQVPPTNQQQSDQPSGTNTAVKEFIVMGQDYSLTPSALSVKKGDAVKIIFKNIEGFHDFKIDEFNAATTRIKTGEEAVLTFVADKTGSFKFYCSVGSHRRQGMEGTLTVTE